MLLRRWPRFFFLRRDLQPPCSSVRTTVEWIHLARLLNHRSRRTTKWCFASFSYNRLNGRELDPDSLKRFFDVSTRMGGLLSSRKREERRRRKKFPNRYTTVEKLLRTVFSLWHSRYYFSRGILLFNPHRARNFPGTEYTVRRPVRGKPSNNDTNAPNPHSRMKLRRELTRGDARNLRAYAKFSVAFFFCSA